MPPTEPTAAHARLLEQQAFLRRLAASLVADPHRAEDLAQDATVIALERPPAREGSMRAWLSRVVHNRAVNVGLAEERRRARELEAAPTSLPRTPDEIEASFQVQRRVIAAVDRLQEPYRTTILLRYYQDLGPSAIAGELGVPVSTVKSRLARGLARLREDLDDSQPEGGRAWAVVLAGGLGQVSKPAGATALATGGIVMGAKLALGVAAGGAIVLGGWWLTRPDSRAEPRPRESVALAAVASSPDSSSTDVLREVVGKGARTSVASAEPDGPPGGKSAPAWVLGVEVHGWSEGDQGPVRLEVFHAEDAEAALTTTGPLADEIAVDVGDLFADPAARPDRLRLRVDHPAYLPHEAGVLVPQELLQPLVLTGQLHTLVELTHARAAVTGTVEVHSTDSEARALVAILPFKFDYPWAEPIEVVTPDPDGQFRLRADDAERHAVVVFDSRSGSRPLADTGVSLRPLTEVVTLSPGEELDLGTLVVDDGLSIEGRVVLPGGTTAVSGQVTANPMGQGRGGPFGLVWKDSGYENASQSTTWVDDGRFVVVGLGPREYSVSAMPPREDPPPVRIGFRRPGASVFVVPPASDVQLTFEESTVRVTFEVRGEGRPLPGAALTIYRAVPPGEALRIGVSWESFTTRTDDAGRRMFELDPLDIAPPDGLRVEARDARHGSKELSLTAEELRTSDYFVIDLDGPPVDTATLVVDVPSEYAASTEGVGIHIRLHDVERSSEQELESARMYSQRSTGGGGRDLVRLEPSGPKPLLTRVGTSWELAEIPAGEYLVRIDPSPEDLEGRCFLLNEQFEVMLAPGDRVVHTWIPRSGGLVRLNLAGPEDRFWAEIVGSDERELGLMYTRSGPGLQVLGFGSKVHSLGFSRVFPPLPPDLYLLRITRKGNVVDWVPFEVEAGQLNDVEVDLGEL